MQLHLMVSMVPKYQFSIIEHLYIAYEDGHYEYLEFILFENLPFMSKKYFDD